MGRDGLNEDLQGGALPKPMALADELITVTDRDLLRIEPSAFVDGQLVSTLLANHYGGVLSGTTFTSAAADFATVEVGPGHVIVIGGRAHEVIERTSATALEVSQPRASDDEPLIPPGDGTNLLYQVPTFARVIGHAAGWVLGVLGVDPPPIGDAVSIADDEGAAVDRLVSWRALAMIFATAATREPLRESLARRAVLYKEEAALLMRRTRVGVDTDGDGDADAVRRMDGVTFVRV